MPEVLDPDDPDEIVSFFFLGDLSQVGSDGVWGVTDEKVPAEWKKLNQDLRGLKYGWIGATKQFKAVPFLAGKLAGQHTTDDWTFFPQDAKDNISMWVVGTTSAKRYDDTAAMDRDAAEANYNITTPDAIILRDKEGKTVGKIDVATIELIQKYAKGYGNSAYNTIFELDIKKKYLKAHIKGNLSKMQTAFWIMNDKPENPANLHAKPANADPENFSELLGAPSWEVWDIIYLNFMHDEQKDSDKLFTKEEHKFNVDTKPTKEHPFGAIQTPQSGWNNLVHAMHPFIEKKITMIGHATDPHVCVDHEAYEKSQIAMLENGDGTPAGKCVKPADSLCDAFDAFHDLLLNQLCGTEKVDAIALTGDLTDSQRSLDPRQVDYVSVGSQWRNFNLLKSINTNGKLGLPLYPRCLDDIAVYSLIMEALGKNVPIFTVTGNHDGYEKPWSKSPRASMFSIWTGIKDKLGVSRIWKKNDFEWEKRLSLKWAERKGNEVIPADHNMYTREIIQINGPAAYQVMTAANFSQEHMDFFRLVFCPFSDWKEKLSGMVLVGCGWGKDEVIVNLSQAWTKFIFRLATRQGDGFLGRPTNSVSFEQAQILSEAAREKGGDDKLVLLTHFPTVSYNFSASLNQRLAMTPHASTNDQPVLDSKPADTREEDKDKKLASAKYLASLDENAGWNQINNGTFEQRQKWFFQRMVNNDLDIQLSGHSHRPGVYSFAQEGEKYRVKEAFDPGWGKDGKTPTEDFVDLPKEGTSFIVTSTGGPQGRQNLDDELAGGFTADLNKRSSWHVIPPTASVIDIANKRIKQIHWAGNGRYEKPRLPIAIDFLQVMVIEDPVFFCQRKDLMATNSDDKPGKIAMLMGDKTYKMQCVDKLTLWEFVGGSKTGKSIMGSTFGKWQSHALEFKESKSEHVAVKDFGYQDKDAKYSYWDGASLIGTPETYHVFEVTVPPELMSTALNTSHNRSEKKFDFKRWMLEYGFVSPQGYGGKFKDKFQPDSLYVPMDVSYRSSAVKGGVVSKLVHPNGGSILSMWRTEGEYGEAPDWLWLSRAIRSKYPDPGQVFKKDGKSAENK
jgi:predicted phosphodiesterase